MYAIRSYYVLVAEKGSFAAAAVVEGVTPVVMGRRLDALERRVGVRYAVGQVQGAGGEGDLGPVCLDDARDLQQDILVITSYSIHYTKLYELKLDGERVVKCVPHLGYLHRGMEKIAEIV